jgi:hypothetical protein
MAQWNDTQALAMLGAGAEVSVRRGQLMLRALSPIPALYRGFRLHPDHDKDPYVFRIDLSHLGMGAVRIVFSRDPAEATTGVHFDGILLSADKRPASQNPRRWGTGALALAATAIAVCRRRAARRRSRMGLNRARREHAGGHRAPSEPSWSAAMCQVSTAVSLENEGFSQGISCLGGQRRQRKLFAPLRSPGNFSGLGTAVMETVRSRTGQQVVFQARLGKRRGGIRPSRGQWPLTAFETRGNIPICRDFIAGVPDRRSLCPRSMQGSRAG